MNPFRKSCRITNDELQMTKEIQSSNDERRLGMRSGVRHSDFGIPSDFVIRHSDLGMAVHGEPPFVCQEGNWESTEECQLPSLPSARPSRFQAPVNPARAAGSRHTFSRAPTRHKARKTFPGAVR